MKIRSVVWLVLFSVFFSELFMNTSEPTNLPAPVKQDGRKRKERTPAQKEAYKRMVEARKQKSSLINLDAQATPGTVAIADVWYSNHELAKEKRRKQKMEDMEKIIAARLDQYHTKILDELQKPVSSFLENFLRDDDNEEEETQPKAAANVQKNPEPAIDELIVDPAVVLRPAARNTHASLLSSTRKRRPATRFF
jgi:hypothetical protein